VLGLLMMQDMTIYELSRSFKTSLALFYSASLGSLQVAARKLLARRLIAFREVREGGRRKKVYRILAAGKAAFRSGMMAPIPASRLEVTALSRLSFLGVLERQEDREIVLGMIVEATSAALEGLERLREEVGGLDVPPSYRGVLRYQLATLEYGIMAHRAGLAWFGSVLEEARRERGSPSEGVR
jgi:DNA-binding PadR family transcriptional regulator